MARPELNLQGIPDLFRQAAVSYRASIWFLLVITLLSSLYETGVENSVVLSGFPFNLSHGNFSFDFDFRGKQSHNPTDGTSQHQKLFVDRNDNAIGASDKPRVAIETSEGQSEQVAGDPAELRGKRELTEYDEAAEEVSDDGPYYLKLKLVFCVGNHTQKENIEDLEESGEVGLFAGRLFGGRVFDQQGGVPQGVGATALLILLILFGLLAIFLGVVALQHSAVLGAVAYTVASTHMGKRVSVTQSLRSGLKSGIWRLIWLAVLHGTLRGLQCLFLMKALFEKVLDMEQMEKLVFRLSLMPFAVLVHWKDAYATDTGMPLRIGAFVGLEYVMDGLAYSVYIMTCWVAIVERQYRGAGTLYRGWNLGKSMAFQEATIKILESVLCGRSFKWVLQKVVGQFLATLTVSFMQTCYLVLWYILYSSARCKENQGQTRQFSHRDLEDFLGRFW